MGLISSAWPPAHCSDAESAASRMKRFALPSWMGIAKACRPRPVVLDRDMQWLRELVVVSEAERAKFWKKMAAVKAKPAPERYLTAIANAMPEPRLSIKTARRVAGTGSLGRPRWVGIAEWRGAPIVREAKPLVTSAWCRAQGTRHCEVRAGEIANGRFRPLDPWYRIVDDVVVRRLSPNNRKIEAEKRKSMLFTHDMLQTMVFELANVHLGAAERRDAIKRDLDMRKRGWLTCNARTASNAITQEYKEWKAS
jgi:hypothetical protein